jgi:hypothetical protein
VKAPGGDSTSIPRSGAGIPRRRGFMQRFARLNDKLVEIIQDHSLVSFLPMSIKVCLLYLDSVCVWVCGVYCSALQTMSHKLIACSLFVFSV